MRSVHESARPARAPYVALAVVFVAASVYLARFTYFAFPGLFGAHPAREPFIAEDTDQPGAIARVFFLQPEARQAGLKQADFLLAVDGQPLKGLAVFGEAVRRRRSGDTLALEVLSGDAKGVKRAVALRLAPYARFGGLLPFVYLYLSPYFCLLLGFWVAAARPRDPRAWFLLFLLLGFSCFLNARLETWGPVLRDYSLFYRLLMLSSFPVWLLWLGVYFPEPFPRDGRGRVWHGLAWVVTAAVAVSTLMSTASAFGGSRKSHGQLAVTKDGRATGAPRLGVLPWPGDVSCMHASQVAHGNLARQPSASAPAACG